MSPEREIDETKGANPPEKVGEEAKEAKKAAAKPRRRTRKKAEEPKAEAAATKPKPRRRTTRKKAEEPKAEAAEATAEDKADEVEEKPAETEEKTEEAKEETPAPRPTPKAQRPTPTGPVAVRARARYVRTSARKARLVCDHIRGKTVPEARAILDFTPRAAARDWTKVLDSAVANAEANHELIGDELKITEAYADEGPTLKRYRPRAMGRATRIRKRTSHLTITLTPVMSAAKERS
jgi:large subunit ribosomal protein L22